MTTCEEVGREQALRAEAVAIYEQAKQDLDALHKLSRHTLDQSESQSSELLKVRWGTLFQPTRVIHVAREYVIA